MEELANNELTCNEDLIMIRKIPGFVRFSISIMIN